ncbi:hypothetical protein [Streptomyces canus]|uniref:hypothetical protein n=1 Tax=Streptomyces canus TaxID=58343 RepID=UPI0037122244
MHGPGRDPHDDRDSQLRFQMIELAANLLALLSILATMLVIVLAADAGPTLIAALATAVSVSFRGWLAYRTATRETRRPSPPPTTPDCPAPASRWTRRRTRPRRTETSPCEPA